MHIPAELGNVLCLDCFLPGFLVDIQPIIFSPFLEILLSECERRFK